MKNLIAVLAMVLPSLASAAEWKECPCAECPSRPRVAEATTDCPTGNLACICAKCKCTNCWRNCFMPNKAPDVPPTYASVVSRVGSGESLVVYAGVALPLTAEKNAVRIDAIPGEPNGVYDCVGVGGVAKMQKREPILVSRPVAVAYNLSEVIYATTASPCANGKCPTPSRGRR